MDSKKLEALLKAYQMQRHVTASGEDRGHVITGPMRLQWPSLASPSAPKNGGALKYRATLIAPAGLLQGALAEIVKGAELEKFAGKAQGLRSPFRKQKEKAHLGAAVGFEDSDTLWFVTASANPEYPPQLMGPGGPTDKLPLDTPALYAGCWVRAKLNAFGYDQSGNRGVSFGILALQKIADDERLSTGSGDASDGFGPVAGAAITNGTSDPFAV
jgi:Protein of unknown function (DUF2815)